MSQRRHSRGFTLVEIMVVLAILVLLIALVGPRVLNMQDKADLKIARTQISMLEETLKQYKSDLRTFPNSEEGLKVLLQRPADEARGKNWQGPYLDEESVPVDPWGNPFRYEFPPTRGTAQDKPNIWSAGPDAKDDTEDDIVNWTKQAEGGVEGETTGAEQQDVASVQQ